MTTAGDAFSFFGFSNISSRRITKDYYFFPKTSSVTRVDQECDDGGRRAIDPFDGGRRHYHSQLGAIIPF